MDSVSHRRFPGNQRLKVLDFLGAGGMGEVYEAQDRQSGEHLALKSLSKLGSIELYLFKNEFRALADITHPNLVNLHELFAEDEQWFFTMDLVEGQPFLNYIWGEAYIGTQSTVISGADRAEGEEPLPTISSAQLLAEAPTAVGGSNIGSSGADETAAGPGRESWSPPQFLPQVAQRLRRALAQLALGVDALHRAGKLHRDLKPSNVLVSEDGELVVLDFGLVQDLNLEEEQSFVPQVSGTLAYMSPEQMLGERLSAASDWYSVGVMLYQALTGRLPHGSSDDLLHLFKAKQSEAPISPDCLNTGLPGDLVALCNSLMAPKPYQRPSADDILSVLGADHDLRAPEGLRGAQEEGFIGREQQLALLQRGLDRSRQGALVSVVVSGRSGMGKTALVERFLDEARQQGVLVLAGRCYERESVPYKALDPLIDALATWLSALSLDRRKAMLPEQLGTLARVFKVLDRFVAEAPPQDEVREEQRLLRQQAFEGLRTLLQRIARLGPLILYIDDLQWSDADSVGRLRELLRQPDPPPVLFLVAARSEQQANHPDVRKFLSCEDEGPLSLALSRLEIGPLSAEESEALALQRLGGRPDALVHAREIAKESGGMPIFVEELSRHVALQESGLQQVSAAVSLEQVIGQRLDGLPVESRAVLEVVALAGRPITQQVAWQAAAVTRRGWRSIAALSVQRLVRTHGRRREDLIECYHDRISNIVKGTLSGTQQQDRHRALGEALEAAGGADPEVLYRHFFEAGALDKAGQYVRRAADQAYGALAFDRAAELYQQCLQLFPETGEGHHQLKLRLAASLVNAGRCPEAARTYLDAASGQDTAEALRLKQQAANAFLESGHLGRGKDLLHEVLHAKGISVPSSPAGALAAFLLLRARLALRGFDFEERPEESISAQELERIDICLSAAVGIGLADPLEGIIHQCRAIMMALNAGEIRRVIYALSLEAAFAALDSPKGLAKAQALLETARQHAREQDDIHLLGVVDTAESIVMLQVGRWAGCHQAASRALQVLQTRRTTTAQEQQYMGAWVENTAQAYHLAGLGFMGRLGEALEQFNTLVIRARQRGDLHLETHVRLGMEFNPYLILDQPDRAESDVQAALEQWPLSGFTLQHNYAMRAQAQIALYQGHGDAALEIAADLWRKLNRSTIRRVGLIRCLALDVLLRAQLATAACGTEPRTLAKAEKLARKLAQIKLDWTEAYAALALGQIASLGGDQACCARFYSEAAERFEAAQMMMHAAVTRWRLGELTDPGLVDEARSWMEQQGGRNPEALARMIAPINAARPLMHKRPV